MEKRYTALRIIGTIYKVFGGIVAVITILAILGFCVTSLIGGAAMDSLAREFSGYGIGGLFGGFLGALIFAVVAIIYGGGLAVTLYAVGEGVYLFLALEENTRATVALLQQQASVRPPVPPPGAGD